MCHHADIFRDGGQSVPFGCRAEMAMFAKDGGGCVVGRGVAVFDVVAGKIVLGRLPGWYAGADDVGSGNPLSMLVLGKMAHHWMVSGLAAGVDGSGTGLAVHMSVQALGVLIIGLCWERRYSPARRDRAALTLAVRAAACCCPLLVLPLCIPVLIFGPERFESDIKRVGHCVSYVFAGRIVGVGLGFHPLGDCAGLRISME